MSTLIRGQYDATRVNVKPGGAKRTLSAYVAEAVKVTDETGADPTGVGNSTAAFLAAMARGNHIVIPPGTYTLDQFTIPATVKRIEAQGTVVLQPSASVPSGATVATWITANNLANAKIGGNFLIQAPSATYPNLTCVALGACTKTEVSDLVFAGAGYNGIQSSLGTSVKILRCSVVDYKGTGIQVAGSSSSVVDVKTEVASCFTKGNGASTVAHGVSFQYCTDFHAHDNDVEAAGTFGIAVYLSNHGKVRGNTSYNSVHEAFNVQDSSFIKVQGNEGRWDAAGPSVDFGISIYGATQNCQFVTVSHNDIVNSGSSGICLTGTAGFGVQYSKVIGNAVTNCNAKQAAVAGGVDNLAGILLSGSATQVNTVEGNNVIDLNGKMSFGIAEHDFGTGLPSSNYVVRNTTFSSMGWANSGVDISCNLPSTMVADNSGDLAGGRAYTVTATASSGALTTYTQAGRYVQVGKSAMVYVNVAISNAGTGAGHLNVTLPFNAVTGGALSGVNTATGKTVSGNVAAGSNTCLLTYSDGTWPGATGANIVLTGLIT